jgi:acylphosphatase
MIAGSVRAHLIISGMVQGVSYRASARYEARRLGLSGWVRNRFNGTVEAMAEGPRDMVQAFIDWCRQGPPSARVSDVQVDWSEAGGEFDGFLIKF